MKNNLANFTGSKIQEDVQKIEPSLIFDRTRYSLASLCSAVVSRWPEGFEDAEFDRQTFWNRFPEDDPKRICY